MKKIMTKRNEAVGENPIAKEYVNADMEKIAEKAPKQSNVPLYTLLVTCAIFLYMVYINLQIGARLDRMEASISAIYVNTNANPIPIIGGTAKDAIPFCYGYDQTGAKGYAVDGRKINTPCEGVNVTT